MRSGCPTLLLQTVLLFSFGDLDIIDGIRCYKCSSVIGSCNEGSCEGPSCIKMEMGEERGGIKVEKTCGSMDEGVKASCIEGTSAGYRIRKCSCGYEFCNDDAELAKSRLEQRNGASGAVAGRGERRSKRTKTAAADDSNSLPLTTNYLIMLIFVCLFVTGSFSLLVVNSVCIHLC